MRVKGILVSLFFNHVTTIIFIDLLVFTKPLFVLVEPVHLLVSSIIDNIALFHRDIWQSKILNQRIYKNIWISAKVIIVIEDPRIIDTVSMINDLSLALANVHVQVKKVN